MNRLSKEDIKLIAKEVRQLQRDDEEKKEEAKRQKAEEKKKKDAEEKENQERESYWKYYNSIEHFKDTLDNDEYSLEDHLKFNKELTELFQELREDVVCKVKELSGNVWKISEDNDK